MLKSEQLQRISWWYQNWYDNLKMSWTHCGKQLNNALSFDANVLYSWPNATIKSFPRKKTTTFHLNDLIKDWESNAL